ncbi:MAG TPA: sporulation protein YqfD [Symbiobacteriaceae bacterium]|jgi:similar to stage IV sporulation protein|nr:sporulation protein YqfD [Symbiobacteriaceae bacterium]
MLKRLVAFLMGYLRIEITGGRIEQFLNLALAQGIYLWQIQRLPDRTRAYLTIRDFFHLRPVARGAGARVQILSRRGAPFLAVKLRRRPALLLGAVACVAFIFWATSHVWIIRVKISGPMNLDPRAVEAVAAEAGLRFGAVKSKIDVNKVQQHIQQRMGEVSWAVIRLQGTRAVIEVVEKAARNKTDEVGCVNLVARKAGVIEEVIPFQGEPQVKKGDIVRAGDLLVECSFKYWPGGRPAVLPGTPMPPRDAVARTLVAQAIVRARITYSRYREIPLYQSVEVPTGRQAVQWVLNWKDRSILLRGAESLPFERVQERRQTYSLPGWRNWKAPVELVIRNMEEVELRREPVSEETAMKQAREQMEAQLRWLLGPADELLTPLQAQVVERSKEFIGVRVTVETLEDIARPRLGSPLPVPAPQPTPDNKRP